MIRNLTSNLTRDDFIKRAYHRSKSDSTKTTVKAALKMLDKFCLKFYQQDSKEIVEEIKISRGDEKYNFLQDFIHFMDEIGLKPSAVKTYLSWCKSYLRTQGVKIYNEDMKALVRLPTEIKELPKPLTLEIIHKILDNCREDKKALYLSLLSSGMRIGEALALRKRDFDFNADPVTITIPGKFTKRRMTRETYISREAKEILERRLKKLSNDHLVFTNTQDNRQAVNNEDRYFHRLRERCGLTQKYSDGKRNVVNIHSMRAWFSTKTSKILGEEYAHALDGHSAYLSQYYRLTSEERAEMYKKLEPHLLVFTSTEFAKTQNELQEQIQQLQTSLKENDETKRNVKKILEHLNLD